MDTNIKMLSKSSRILIKILFLFLIISCSQKKDTVNISSENSDSKLFTEEIDGNMAIFKEYDSIHYLENIHFLNASKLCKEANDIIKLIQSNELDKEVIISFKKHLNEYCTTTHFIFEYDDLKKMDDAFKIFKIRAYQTVAINSLLNKYKSFYYPMEFLKPIIVPRKNIVKVGEKFIADIYLAGNNATNKYIVVINNDTLKYNEGENFPAYETTPVTSKGEKGIDAVMKIYHPNLHRAINLPFSYKYIVQ